MTDNTAFVSAWAVGTGFRLCRRLPHVPLLCGILGVCWHPVIGWLWAELERCWGASIASSGETLTPNGTGLHR